MDKVVQDGPSTRGIGGPGDPEVTPLLLPVPQGSTYTVTVANPTPPTNIAYVSYGTGPVETMTPNPAGRGAPTYAGDCLLMDTANDSVPAIGALTVCAAPTGGSSAAGHEAIGSVTIVTAPGSRTECPTQMISTMGNWTGTPNASHPSMAAPTTLPTITGLLPVAPVGTGGSSSLTVNGTGFRPDSVVYVGGMPYNTQFNSTTQLSVLNAPKRTSAGNTAITVMTGGTATAATNWVFS
jgi:hypothetical protein